MKPGIAWFSSMSISGGIVKLISRLMSQHTGTNAHLTDKNILNNAACDCGAEQQDVNHLFFNCPIYKTHSDKLLLDLHRTGIDHNCDINAIAFTDQFAAFQALWCFVQSTKIRI